MSFIDKVTEYVCNNEGFVPYTYKDTKDIDTIGYGRNLKVNPLTEYELRNYCYLNPNNEICIFEDKAKIFVSKELQELNNILKNKYKWYKDNFLYNMNRNIAILDIVYNIGLNKFESFKNFINYMSKEEFQEAAEELLKGSGKDGKSKYYEQVGNRALNNSKIIKTNNI